MSMMAVEDLPVLYEDNWMMHGVVSRCISSRKGKDDKESPIILSSGVNKRTIILSTIGIINYSGTHIRPAVDY
jgi:hypothetical protein